MTERKNNASVVRGFSNIDATAEFETDLVDQLNYQYPPATKPADLYIPDTSQATFASFDLRQKHAGAIVTQALRLSADPDQDITFCHHANQGHLAFAETVDWLSKAIESPDNQVVCLEELDITRDHPCHRLCLTTEKYREKVFHPPATIAYVLKVLNPEANSATSPETKQKIIAKHLRSLVTDKGLGFAMIVANHLCIPYRDASKILSFENIKDKPDNCFKPGNKQHRQTFHKLREILTTESRHEIFASRSRQDFKTVVDYLKQQGMVRTGIEIVDLEATEPLSYKFKPVAVLCGMVEKAYELASDRYQDPRKTTFVIDNYLDRYTTQVITAYLEFHPHSQMVKW